MSLEAQRSEYMRKLQLLKDKGYSVRVRHNDHPFRTKGHSPKYVTVCAIFDDKTMWIGESLCSPKDVPSRKLGWAIAVGRALHSYEKGTAVSL